MKKLSIGRTIDSRVIGIQDDDAVVKDNIFFYLRAVQLERDRLEGSNY